MAILAAFGDNRTKVRAGTQALGLFVIAQLASRGSALLSFLTSSTMTDNFLEKLIHLRISSSDPLVGHLIPLLRFFILTYLLF